jgi:hypothetical protein
MKNLAKFNPVLAASLLTIQPFFAVASVSAQNVVKPTVYSIDQLISQPSSNTGGSKPATIPTPPTKLVAPKPITGIWVRNALAFKGDTNGCTQGGVASEISLKLYEQGGSIFIIGNDNKPTSSGNLSGREFTLTNSSNGFTFKYTGTLNAARNEITGRVSCQYALGKATTVQNFTLKLQSPSVPQATNVPQVTFAPSTMRETSATSYELDLTGSDGTKATIVYRRLSGKVFQEEIRIQELNRTTGSHYLASTLRFSPDGRQVEVKIPNSRESIVARGNANNTVTVTATDQFGVKTTQTSTPQASEGSTAQEYAIGLCKAIDAFCGGVDWLSKKLFFPDLLVGKFIGNFILPYKYLQIGLNISSFACWIMNDEGKLPPGIPFLSGNNTLLSRFKVLSRQVNIGNEVLYGLTGFIADKGNIKFSIINTAMKNMRKAWGLDFCDKETASYDATLSSQNIAYQQSAQLNVKFTNPIANTHIIEITGSDLRGMGYVRRQVPDSMKKTGEVNFTVTNAGYAFDDGRCTSSGEGFIGVAILSTTGEQLFYKQIKPVRLTGPLSDIIYPCSARIRY